MPTAGVPLIAAEPTPAVNTRPVGSEPATEMLGAGVPVAVMLIVPAWPTTNVVEPVTSSSEAGSVAVVEPGASQPDDSPP